MARTKRIRKILPAKYAWGSFDTDDESYEYETEPSIITQFESCWLKDKYPYMDTFKLQSLVRDLENFANMPNPNV